MEEEKSLVKENLILQAARKRFAYYGFSKVTMDEIARDIGMGKASLYYYFPTKESLFKAVISHEQDEFIYHAREFLQTNISAGQKLREYARLRLQYFRELVNLSKLSFHSLYEMKPVFSDLFERFAGRESEIITKILREGSETGELNVEDPRRAAELLLHVFQGLRLRILPRFHDTLVNEESYEHLGEEMLLFVNIFLRGIESKN
jgi:TetR/AcrR family transcriptional regulator